MIAREMTRQPMVSCIMPTCDRRPFFEQALRGFDRQTWPARELVVVDDGDDPVRDLCEAHPSVRYVRLEGPTPTGVKLNAGIACAAGAIVQPRSEPAVVSKGPRQCQTDVTQPRAARDVE